MHFAKLSGNDNKNYLVSAFFGAITLTFFSFCFPGFIPYKAFELWNVKGSIEEWILAGLPILIWGSSVTLFFCIFTKNDMRINNEAEKHFIKGSLLSIWAGIMEEICFRWLIFLSAIVTIKIANFLFFDWFFGFGLSKLITTYLMAPVANFFTLGYLGFILQDPSKWAVAAALLMANAFFRDGHKYQGWFGFINSWFGGMFFFWLMFKFGLLAAILVHFLYDFLIDVISYVDRVFERGFSRFSFKRV